MPYYILLTLEKIENNLTTYGLAPDEAPDDGPRTTQARKGYTRMTSDGIILAFETTPIYTQTG
ncbi:MAG: hypothetical protein A3G34_01235 [Candidatus Lindowbacteria bacterium RIFCSPLOWO2_12_FULL_62_27]|nr:MAG: hypothetical protein A3G34_01235 [Candidatus Lindowbacteria bacterium RIFCSPLOWO2_12_FULL_62_27]